MPVFFVMLILGLVQGLTEFLPVSSSGHLVLLGKLFGIQENLFVSIILHCATLISILIVLRKEVWYYIRHPLSPGSIKLALATIPTCLIVLVIMPFVTESFEGGILPYCFLITMILLLFTDFYCRKKISFVRMGRAEDFNGISYKQAIFMGIAQGFAVFPGVSRSGSTICTGLVCGSDRNSVAKFSFLMSVPIIILSTIKEIYDLIVSQHSLQVDALGLSLGSIIACLVGVFAIKYMINLTQKVRFKWFVGYLAIIAIVSFILMR